jgi:hypothetical protein
LCKIEADLIVPVLPHLQQLLNWRLAAYARAQGTLLRAEDVIQRLGGCISAPHRSELRS